jgi:acyl-coenzyme A synthetase/AMP-(fatty) acid ligase
MAMGGLQDPETVMAEGFAGRPLPDRLAFVGDADCVELPAGKVGEVMVTHGFFDHYRNKPDKTAETKRGDVLHTGDLGVSNEDGYLKVLGRLGEAARARERGGFLREVEDTLYEHDSVQHAVVVESRDGHICGFVELLSDRRAEPDELHQFLSARVSRTLVPKQIQVLDKMPRSFSGKADRLKLSARGG